MGMPGRVWSTLLISFFIGWCGGERAATNQSVVGESTTQQAQTVKVSLDFTPMTDPVSTFVSIKPDNQVRVVRYSRSLLVVQSIGQGNLPQQEVAKLGDKTRALASADAICTKGFGSPGPTRGDQFHLTLNLEEKEKECFGFVQDSPAAIRSVVEELVSTSQKLSPAPLADAYLRSEPISQNRYEALRKSISLKFVNVEEFPNDIQSVLSMAINQPRDFFVLTREQRKSLLDLIANGHELFITHKSSHHQITIFSAQK